MQIVLIYQKPFWRNSLLKYMLQPKIATKFTKTPYFGVQGHSRSSTLTFLRSLLKVIYDKHHVCAYLEPFSC